MEGWERGRERAALYLNTMILQMHFLNGYISCICNGMMRVESI